MQVVAGVGSCDAIMGLQLCDGKRDPTLQMLAGSLCEWDLVDAGSGVCVAVLLGPGRAWRPLSLQVHDLQLQSGPERERSGE